MTSFQIAISPKRRAAGRFIADVRRKLQRVLTEEARDRPLSQADIARALQVDRAVITRELHGKANISLGRIAELAWAMGRRPVLEFEKDEVAAGRNVRPIGAGATSARTDATPAAKILTSPLPASSMSVQVS